MRPEEMIEEARRLARLMNENIQPPPWDVDSCNHIRDATGEIVSKPEDSAPAERKAATAALVAAAPRMADLLLLMADMMERLMGLGITHYDGCWDRGQSHYVCAVRKIKSQQEVIRRAIAALDGKDAPPRIGWPNPHYLAMQCMVDRLKEAKRILTNV